MIDCLILGDSIAKGISDIRKECVAYVKSGINSHDYFNKRLLNNEQGTAKSVIISLGSNDTANINTYEELDNLRKTINAEKVYWILPNIKDSKRKNVWEIAYKYNDMIIDARVHERSQDTVHPTYKGYKTLAEETK